MRNKLNYSLIVLLFLILIIFIPKQREAFAASRFIKYLTVAPNEGDSSGGHTAIRFDTDTFHFQHISPGLIKLQRHDSPSFDYMYSMLGNRSIQESWIAVSNETYNLLQDSFSQFLFIQENQFSYLDTLRMEVRLYQHLVELRRQTDPLRKEDLLPMRGFGYFLKDEFTPFLKNADLVTNLGTTQSRSLKKLKSMFIDEYGNDYIEQQISLRLNLLSKSKWRATKLSPERLSREVFAQFERSSADMFYQDISAVIALGLLQSEQDILSGSYWATDSEEFLLSEEDIAALGKYSSQLTGNLFQLYKSQRTDWAYPFIVGMARLAVIERSISSGKMTLLNIFPEDISSQDNWEGGPSPYLRQQKDETASFFRKRQRELLSSTDKRESDYSAIELLGNSFLDLERAINNRNRPRPLPELPLPTRSSLIVSPTLPDMTLEELEEELAVARKAEREHEAQLRSIYAYDLFRRNCVTEIFSFIEESFARISKVDSAGTANNESIVRLGGYIDASKGLTFIPAVSSSQVNACYNVKEVHERPSYRASRLAEMQKNESAFTVFLRESNTITSTIYRRSPNDSPFLFFTEENVFLRPIYGVCNLLYGVADSLAGLVTLPLDRGRKLYLGAKGVMFSLPELVFINIRKGSMDYIAGAGQHTIPSH